MCGPFLLLVGVTGSEAVLVPALLMYGVVRGFYDCNTMPVLCQVARSELRSTGYGIFNFASCLAGGATAAAAGWLKSVIGLGATFQIGAALLVLSALLLLRLRRALLPAAQLPLSTSASQGTAF